MLSIFAPTDAALRKTCPADLAALPENAVWIDLDKPTPEEDRAVERLAGIAVPTREDMQEIEISSRLYVENGARYMTATPDVRHRHRNAAHHADHLHPRQPSSRHRALRRAKAVHAGGEQARARHCARHHRRGRAAGTARRRDRPLRRHSGARRRRRRSGQPRHLRAGRVRAHRSRQALFRNPDHNRPQGRSHLESARKSGLDRPPRHLRHRRGRQRQMVEGDARATQDHAARRRRR